MSCFCYSYNITDRNYLRSPIGCLKSFNIILGAISLVLISVTFVSGLEDDFCLTAVTIFLICSMFYFLMYDLHPELRFLTWNRRFDNIFHLIGGVLLIIAGIDFSQLANLTSSGSNLEINNPKDEKTIIGDQYFEPGYVKGAGKIIIFINGVIYLILGFIRVKDEEEYSYDEFEEDEESELLCDV